jgi:hypothetical protein
MSAIRVQLALALTLLTAIASAAPAAPRVVCHGDGRWVISALPPTLRDPEVLDYLKSGLTTTLAVSLRARGVRGEKLSVAARIDVRFEPWEQFFDVRVLRADATAEARRVASEPELHAWWRDLTLSFVLPGVPRGSAQVSVELIPFSEDEQADTRRWYAESLRGALAADPGSSAIGGVFDALTLTSIKRQGVLRFSWSAAVERVR